MLAARMRAPTFHPHDQLSDEQIQQSLRTTHREAVFFSLMLGLTEPFLIPYALALGAGAFEVGVLSAARSLIPALAQLRSADAVIHWTTSRKNLVVWTVGVQALVWVPVAFIGSCHTPWAVPALIGLSTLAATSNALGSPAWGSMVSQHLAPRQRGRFFGHRGMLTGIWMTVGGLLGGSILRAHAKQPLVGFRWLCLSAALSRTGSWYWLRRFRESPVEETRSPEISLRIFLSRTSPYPIGRFALCMGAVGFATYLSLPFYAVYMVRDLHYSYLTYTILMMLSVATGTFTVPWWGRLSDARGPGAVLRWTICGDALLPILWALCRHPVLIGLLQLLGGWFVAGFNLSMTNYIYDASRPAQRTRVLAYAQMIYGCSVSAGGLVGGWWLERWLPFGRGFVMLFGAATCLRVLAAFAFSRFMQGLRHHA